MSYNTFPTLIGVAWDIKKRIIWSTNIETAASGAEYRTTYFSSPLYEFDLQFNYLSQADWNTLQAFYIAQQGPLMPFLLQQSNDYQVTNLQFAGTNGAASTFQLNTPDGDATPYIVGTPLIYANGTQILPGGPGAPGSPVLNQTAGGSKAARTYYVRLTYVDVVGNETAASLEASIAVLANKLMTIASPPAATGAVSYNIYVYTASNGEKGVGNVAVGTNYTEPTSAYVWTGGAYPTLDNTPYVVSSTGVVQFTDPPANAIALTWTGQYAYLVRFNDDKLETNQFANAMYEQTGLTLRSVR